MKIAIMGGEITGLSAAYTFVEKGPSVTVFEASEVPSGLGTYHTVM